MKAAAIVATAGVVAANYGDAMNALKIHVSEYGQKAIKKEGMDVKKAAHQIQDWPATTKLHKALEKFAHSKAVARVHKLDKKFMKSPAGQKLIKEWKDVGEELKKAVHPTKNGVKINNFRLNHHVSNELDDVSDHYEYLGKTHWAKKYDAAYKNLAHSPAFKNLHAAGKSFKNSKAGHVLGKEVGEFGGALKKHVKVTDIPKKWQKKMNGLKIEVSEDGQDAIEGEAEDIKEVWEGIKDSDVTLDLGHALQKWGTSSEINDLKALDKSFQASEDGLKLRKEWEDFGHALHEAIEKTDNGIHIHNSKMDGLEDEVDDIKEQYDYLETTHWNKDFHNAFEAAFTNDEWTDVNIAGKAFEESDEGEALKGEIMDLKEALEEHVKVTDIPEEWMEEMDQ